MPHPPSRQPSVATPDLIPFPAVPTNSATRHPPLLPLGVMVAAIAFGGNAWAQAAPSTPAAKMADGETLPTIDVKGSKTRRTGLPGAKDYGRQRQSGTARHSAVGHRRDPTVDPGPERRHAEGSAAQCLQPLSFNAGEGGRIGDNINLRGFSAYGDIYLDGMRDVAQYNRDTFNIDHLDVLRGSASMLFGRGSTGGVINQSSKMPFLGEKSDLDLTYGSDDYKRATVDLNRRVGANGAFRLNVMKTNAGSFRDGASTNSVGIAPSFSWGIDSEDEFNLSYYHLSYKDVPNLGLPWYKGQPIHDASGVNVPVTRSYGFSNDWQNDSADIFTASWIHRFDNDTSLKTVLRAGGFDRDLRATQPRLGAGAVNR